MRIYFSWVKLILIVPLLLVLSAQTAYAQDDILDEIEAELKKEEEQNKAQAKADKNKEKYEKLYQTSIRKGDALLRARKYSEAIAAYTEAKKYAPKENYPEDQIALAKQEKKKADEAEKEAEIKEKYNAAITRADAYFNGQKYQEAISAYQEAAGIKTDEIYPKDQINEAKQLITKKEEEEKKAAETAKIEKEYTAAMSKGDAAMKSKDFNAAVLAYESAIKIKPNDPEPKSRKTTAEKMKADAAKRLEQEAKQKKYDDLISAADGLLKSSEFDQAKTKYEEASKVMPNETYPKTKMKECEDSKLAAAQAKERAAYDELVQEADALVKTENFDQAIAKYEEAVKILPHETHPKDMIVQVENLKKEKAKNEIEANFQKVLAEAEKLIAAEKFDEGIQKLGEAHKVMPQETKTKELIAKAEKLKVDKAIKLKADEYDAKLKEGEELLNAEKFDEAIASFEMAKKMMPNDHKAQTLIDQANQLKEGKKQAATQAQFDEKIRKGEAFLNDDRFDEAIVEFEEAQKILPNDHKPATLISQANEIRKTKEKEIAKREYDELLASGDKQLEQGDFSTARESYKNALKAYAEGQGTIDARLAKVDLAEKEKLDAEKAEADAQAKKAQFENLIAEADGLIASKDYGSAKQKVEGALQLFPNDTDAKNKKSEIDTLMAKAEKEKQEKLAADAAAKQLADKEAQVTDFLTQAESKKKAGELQGAKSLISSALTVMPDNENAKSALKDIETAIEENDKKLAAELADKQAAEKAEADKKATINDLLKAGNSLFASGSFQESISKYDEVLSLEENNATALAKKSEAQKAIEKIEQENMAAEEKAKTAQAKKDKIAALSSEAKSAESAENYDAAIAKWNEVLSVDASNKDASDNISRLKQKKLEIAAAALAAEEAAALKKAEEAKQLEADAKAKAEAEKQAQISTLTSEAKDAESSENYDEAINKWNQILELEAANANATAGITRAENKKKEKAAALAAADAAEKLKQEEAAKKLAEENAAKAEAEKQAQISSLTSEAKDAESSENYDGAINKWNQILELEAANANATAGITRAENKKKEKATALAAANAAEKKKQEAAAKKLAEEQKQEKIISLSNEAQQAEISKNLPLALSKWKEVVGMDATNSVATSNVTRLESRIEKEKAEQLAAEEAKRKKEEAAAAELAEKEKRNMIASYLEIGDKILLEKQYEKAIENYEKAQNLDADNPEILSKINRAKELKVSENKRIAAMEAAERQQEINLLLSDAKLLAIKRQYLEAKNKYDKVLSYESENQKAKEGIASIQEYLDQISKREAEEEARRQARAELLRKVEVILDDGADLFAGGQYKEAMAKYKEGLELDPLNNELKASIRNAKQAMERKEQYRIAKLHHLPRPKPEGFKTETIGNSLERTDKTKFQNELGTAYPEGVTEEKKSEKRKDITRRVVVKDGVGSEYFKIQHEWGGIYYFHDGESIDPYKWQYGTRSPDLINNP